MKNISRIKLKNLLTEEESKELKGGADNINAPAGCKCTYYNGDGRTNYNWNGPIGSCCTCAY